MMAMDIPKRVVVMPCSESEVLVREPFVIDLNLGKILVQEGFRTDGASIPRILWSSVFGPFHPLVMEAAAAHDWMYSQHAYQRGGDPITRERADRIFLAVLRYRGVSAVRARAMYLAVRLFGRLAWRRRSGKGLDA